MLILSTLSFLSLVKCAVVGHEFSRAIELVIASYDRITLALFGWLGVIAEWPVNFVTKPFGYEIQIGAQWRAFFCISLLVLISTAKAFFAYRYPARFQLSMFPLSFCVVLFGALMMGFLPINTASIMPDIIFAALGLFIFLHIVTGFGDVLARDRLTETSKTIIASLGLAGVFTYGIAERYRGTDLVQPGVAGLPLSTTIFALMAYIGSFEQKSFTNDNAKLGARIVGSSILTGVGGAAAVFLLMLE